MFNQRPPAPHYKTVWCVDTVVQYIGSTFASADLSLKNLSMKLVMLMALSNASRASDLASLDIRFQQFTPEGVKFFVPGLTKTRRSGPPKEAFFGQFHEKSLCPVNTLILYEEKTKALRMSTPNEPSPLLISFRKPHKPVTPASIGRWIKELLGKAGINTEIFKGHSSRAASSSAAKVQGYQLQRSWLLLDGHVNLLSKDSIISPRREATSQKQY